MYETAPSQPCDKRTILLLMLLFGAQGMDERAREPSRVQSLQQMSQLRTATIGRYGCRYHKDCVPNEFCAAEFCAEGDVLFPCGKCRSCDACTCNSFSIDNHCSGTCGMERFSLILPVLYLTLSLPATYLTACCLQSMGTVAGRNLLQDRWSMCDHMGL